MLAESKEMDSGVWRILSFGSVICVPVHVCTREKLLHDVLPREKCGLQSALLLYAFTSKMTFLDNRLV